MSRSNFQARLDAIDKTRAVARHETQSQPTDYRGEHTEDGMFEPLFDYLEMAFIAVMTFWLAVDFTAAMPYYLAGAAGLVALHVFRAIWAAVFGSRRRRSHAIHDLIEMALEQFNKWT